LQVPPTEQTIGNVGLWMTGHRRRPDPGTTSSGRCAAARWLSTSPEHAVLSSGLTLTTADTKLARAS
jgi:hypothetical protein